MNTTKKIGPKTVECLACRLCMTMPKASAMDPGARITCKRCGQSFSLRKGRQVYLGSGGVLVGTLRTFAVICYTIAGGMTAVLPIVWVQQLASREYPALAIAVFFIGAVLHALSAGLAMLRDIRDRLPLPD